MTPLRLVQGIGGWPRHMGRRVRSGLKFTLLGLVVAIQLASSSFFVFKLLSDLFLWQAPIIPWEIVELLEILASVGMLMGLAFSIMIVRQAIHREKRVNNQLEIASGQLQEHVERQFRDWGFTPTERAVALLIVKGFSNPEIAAMRGTTESTVKSQVTAIFRKSGLGSRQQFLTSFVEDLIAIIPMEPQDG